MNFNSEIGFDDHPRSPCEPFQIILQVWIKETNQPFQNQSRGHTRIELMTRGRGIKKVVKKSPQQVEHRKDGVSITSLML
jgi:hypothetical protein